MAILPRELIDHVLALRTRLMRADRVRASRARLAALLRFPGPYTGFDRHEDSPDHDISLTGDGGLGEFHRWWLWGSYLFKYHFSGGGSEVTTRYSPDTLGTYRKRLDRWERVVDLHPSQPYEGDMTLLDGGKTFHEDAVPGLLIVEGQRIIHLVVQPLPIPFALAEHARNLPRDTMTYLKEYYQASTYTDMFTF